MIFLNELKKRGHFFRKNVIALFSMFFVIVVAAGVLLCWVFSGQEIEKTQSNIDKNAECISNVTDEMIFNTINQMKNLCVQDRFRMFFINSEQDIFYSNVKQVISTLTTTEALSPFIESVYLYSEHKDYVVTNNGTVNINKADPTFSFIEKYNTLNKNELVSYFNGDQEYKNITFIFRAEKGDKRDGGMIVNVNIPELLSYGQNIGYIMLADENREIFYTNRYDADIQKMQQLADKGNGIRAADREYYAISQKKSQYADIYYYIAEKLPEYGKRLISIYVFIVFVLVVLSVLFYKLSIKIAEINYRPIEELSEIINNPDSQKSKKYLENDKNTKYIADRIFETVSNNERLAHELKTKMEMYDNAQLKVLQWQINPHFMFNTLNMLYYMSNDMNGSSNKLSKALLSLSRFIRYSLKTEPVLVRLRDEIDIINEYIKVMQMRLDISFDVKVAIDEQFLDKKIIKMALQPVLENCFSHGIKNIDYQGIIEINARNTGEFFEIIISDNGNGIEPGKLEELNNQLLAGAQISEAHIGLSNINSRMIILYGDKYGVRVDSEHGKGTAVVLRFPA